MKELKNVLNEHKEEYIKYLSELVSIDTQDLGHGIDGGREEKGQEYLIKLLEKMGADKIEKDALEEETIKKCLQLYNEGNLGHNYDHRYNVYATFAGKGGKSIMFNGHMDTMPPGDLSKWITKPHCPDIRDNRMYGLGTADMKGGLMASVLAIKLLKDAGIELPGDVIITSVCDEEGGGNGSMLAAMNGKKADGVVVCEGTSDELIVAHMGFVFFDVKIEGKANHSGAKWLGVSAIEKAIKLIRGLEELEHGWLMEYKHPLLPAPSLNVGVIAGGTAGSTVAGECEFKVCVHYLPEIMSYEKVVSEFTDTIEGIANGDKWLKDHKPEISVYQAGGAFEMERTHPFVEAFAEGYKQAKGRTPNIVGSPSGCDSRIWKNVAKCPTIQFGPGNLEQCHSVNEYLDMDAYLESILIYAELILAWGKNK
ncbi:M20 family metallopeptidase [Dorea sp. Marseille-P4042]|uniref:M20 family metallopeptidase n=1 Tax=Dorea sp. Marseille-P4042 TaxID=2080749 RepID=UPI000CF93866|nr:M20 family metallopeptidase [Dorea sp. Marseille-P4042]